MSYRDSKNIYQIAKKLQQQKQSINYDNIQLSMRQKQQQQQAMKMLNAYRKVQGIKQTNISFKAQKPQTQKQPISKPSSYSSKIKQTLRQLNANKQKQFQKIQKPLKSQKSLEINNTKQRKLTEQKRLMQKAIEKIILTLGQIKKRIIKQSFNKIYQHFQSQINQDYNMARRYRLFRVFVMWKQTAKHVKKQKFINKQKQTQAIQIANEFFHFVTTKKVFKYWIKFVRNQKKKKIYNDEIQKLQLEKIVQRQEQTQIVQVVSKKQEVTHLQSKVRGFLDGLKDKIQNKDGRLKTIKQKTQQSMMVQQKGQNTINQSEPNQQTIIQANINQISQQPQAIAQQNQVAVDPKKPLTNEQLLSRRYQVAQRSKTRRQALQKLKKQKQDKKQKQYKERKQLQKEIQEQEKKEKQAQYKEFQKQKIIQKEWEIKEEKLMKMADQFNQRRLIMFFGIKPWRKCKSINNNNVNIIASSFNKIMTRHLGVEFIQNLQQNMNTKLQFLYKKMQLIHNKNLKKKTIISLKQQRKLCIQQKHQLLSFHQVHTQKIYLSQWLSLLSILKLQNLQQQRPLLKKANEYRKISLLFKTIRTLKQHKQQSKKQRNINQQKEKIKNKIKGIIQEKIQINYDQFL